MMNTKSLFTWMFALLLSGALQAQSYESFFTGDEADLDVEPSFGVVLMGGAGENDEAMKWFLEQANGGDVVVLRASGSDGYNDYFFSDLGVTINSVETILFNDASAAEDPYVIEQVQNAEAIWMAGGNQWDYISYWRGTAIEDAINNLLNVRGGVVGGISAGMAVMGDAYFSAENGTVYSDEALEDPYNQYMTIGFNDFIEAPFMENTITDTHYDDPDRAGRHTTFLARMYQDYGVYPKGIACDEYAAVCIDDAGIAWCYGEAPEYDDYVYFLRPNCDGPIGPEVCEAGQPLTWNDNNEAVKVYRINATLDGDQYMNLNNWTDFSGGEWFNGWAEAGVLGGAASDAPDCAVSITESDLANAEFAIWPNPSAGVLHIESPIGTQISIFHASGKVIQQVQTMSPIQQLDLSDLASGVYLIQSRTQVTRVVIE
ncbi:T9SS type A sorting domain-containing protein [Sanyastnella coralliicola]|uniref:T9SS type A sorting domain-containing protein n=1 Tax=Sanyastnella coralliicola TaxID=3069118 RepID=UPI0027BA2B2F|nr:T9SS type A sorting domain-containing protein [Longitalea sp. SCSIO 12813]